MDRNDLRKWLGATHRTFRWNDGATRSWYDAVETTDRGLRWYHWSHGIEDGGAHRERLQSYADFRRNGPSFHEGGACHAIPDAVLEELREWVETNWTAP